MLRAVLTKESINAEYLRMEEETLQDRLPCDVWLNDFLSYGTEEVLESLFQLLQAIFAHHWNYFIDKGKFFVGDALVLDESRDRPKVGVFDHTWKMSIWDLIKLCGDACLNRKGRHIVIVL